MKQLLLALGFLIITGLSAENLPKVNLYPNPANNFIRVSFSETIQTDIVFTVSDILGNKIETYTFKPSESLYIDLTPLNLINGMYLIKIEAGGAVHLKRLLVKNN